MPDEGAPHTEAELEERLSRPSAAAVAALGRCPGDVVVLGAGGKMGPSLARMLRRAADSADGGSGHRRVVAVSRFTDASAARALESCGVEIVRADLAEPDDVRRLPDAPNVFFLAGQKFGTSGDPGGTWAMNVVVPSLCADRYRGARIVAFSTGNVYGRTPSDSGGATEVSPPEPVGEYAWSCVGRERVFGWHAARHGTRVSVIRLNYAVDLRYGVVVDVAGKVMRGEPVDVAMGYVNVIWQGDANAAAIAALPLAASPPWTVNVTGVETTSIRSVALRLGTLLGRAAAISSIEAPDALLSNAGRMRESLGVPSVHEAMLVEWVAAWLRAGGRTLAKPTHFEARDGRF